MFNDYNTSGSRGVVSFFVKLILLVAVLGTIGSDVFFFFLGGAGVGSIRNELKGDITGNTYNVEFYTNSGSLYMTTSGQKIDMKSNVVRSNVFSSDSGTTKSLSSVITITVDGHQVETCGSTVLFAENGLTKEVDFNQEELLAIKSSSDSFSDNVFIARFVNNYKNFFGKPVVVVIQSQLGEPICAYSGDSVYWKVDENLPKTTKLMIDGRALYIHRANFNIIDLALLES